MPMPMHRQHRMLVELATRAEFVSGDSDAAAAFVTNGILGCVRADRAYVWEIVDPRSLAMRLVAAAGVDADPIWRPAPDVVRRALEGGPVVETTSAGAPFVSPGGAALCVPIRLAGRVIGALCVEVENGDAPWSGDDTAFCTALANQLGLVQLHRDARRQETADLRVAEIYQRAIAAAGAAPYIEIYDPNVYIFMGDQIEKLTGYTPEEFTPDLLTNICVEHVVRGEGTGMALNDAVELARRGEFEFWQCDMAVRTKSGEIRWISEISVENMGPDGRSSESIGLLIDITDRVVAEREVRRIEDIYRRAITAAGAVPYVHSYKPVERYTFVDAGIAQLTGYTPEEVTPAKLESITVSEEGSEGGNRRRLDEAIAKARSGENVVWRHDTAIRTKDGRIRWISDTSVEVLGSDGTSEGSIGMLQDITERKRAEEERLEMQQRLLHTQKLESLGILAGGIAHDFNNLLVAIVGNLELALEHAQQDEVISEYMRPALDAACRASDLSRQMLAYSGKGQFLVTAVNLSDIVERNALMLRSAVPKNVALNLNLAAPLPRIEADSGQIQQIVMNLITNAAEAIGDEGGSVVLATGVAFCSAEQLSENRSNAHVDPGNFVYVEVADSGCGMNEDALTRLFDPFFTTKFTGRGLGMSAVLGIVRGHRGAIFVESRPGAGSRIRVLFPVSSEAIESAADTPSPPFADIVPAAGRKLRILVVDDEDIVRTLCKRMLERLGHEVHLAADGVEGVELFRADQAGFDCVILDLTMPRLNGHGAFRELKRIRPDVKVILASGYSEEQINEEFLGQGLTGFIQKPFMMRQIAEALERIA